MVVRVFAEVTKDAISVSGRVIAVTVNTNDEFINKLLPTPYIFNKTFPLGTSTNTIKKEFKSDISSTINSIKQRITDESLEGRKLEFNV